MIKAVVLSPSYNYYTFYIRNKSLTPHDYPYYMGNALNIIQGLSKDVPFYFLEGWSENDQYTKEDISFIKNKFKCKELSKGWIESENFSF